MNRTERRKSAKSEKTRVDETIASGLDLMRQGNFQAAQRAFRNVISVQPRNAEALRRLGTIALLEQNVSAAEDLFRRSLIVRPNDSDTHNDLGYAIQQTGRFEEALSEYEKAMDLDPSRIEYKTNYATILIRGGRATEAEAAVNAALLIDETDSRALFLKGLLCKANDRVDEAIEAMKGAIASDPIMRDAHLNLSEMRHYLDGGEAFIESYESAYKVDTSNPRTALLYTEALHKCGRYLEIENVLRPFLDGPHGKQPSILNGMAYTLASQGKFDEALEFHKQALQVAHEDVVTHQNYGRTLVQHGDYRSAIEQFKKVSREMPLAQDMLALSSLAFAQIDDPQAQVLNDRERLIFETTYAPPDGSLEEFNTSLREDIEKHTVLDVHPFDIPKRLSSTIRQGVLSETEGGDGIAALTTFVGQGIGDFSRARQRMTNTPSLL